jgi:hypothetical protein
MSKRKISERERTDRDETEKIEITLSDENIEAIKIYISVFLDVSVS